MSGELKLETYRRYVRGRQRNGEKRIFKPIRELGWLLFENKN
jgi:hypothetical protein